MFATKLDAPSTISQAHKVEGRKEYSSCSLILQAYCDTHTHTHIHDHSHRDRNKGNFKINNKFTPVIGSNTEAYERQTNCRRGSLDGTAGRVAW